MVTNYYFTLPDYQFQVDYSTNLFTHKDSTVQQYTNTSIMLVAKPQTKLRTKITDTISEVISMPHTLITTNYAVKNIENYKQIPNKNNNATTHLAIKSENLNTNIFKPTSWLIGAILLSMFVFAFIRLFFIKNYRTIIKSGYNYNYSVKLFNEANSGSKRVSAFLNIIFIINASIFIYLYTGYSHINFPVTNVTLIGFLIISIIIMYSIKYLVIKIIGYIFSANTVASEYISNIWLYNKLLGISLFPIIVTLPYINYSIKMPIANLGLLMFLMFFIFRIIRSINIVFKIKLSIIYWILYLCTLEILPIFVLSKIVNN